MIEKLAIDIVGQMTEDRLIDDKYKEHYIYAFISLVERFLTVGTIILLSLVIKTFFPTLFFLFFFLSLRKRTGGYHFNCFYQCYLGTVITYLMIIGINAFMVKHPFLLLGLLLLAIGIIEVIGTVNHPNMHMDSEELAESKKAARILVLLEGSVIYCLFFLRADMIFISYMSIAVILCAALLGFAKIIRQEVMEREEG